MFLLFLDIHTVRLLNSMLREVGLHATIVPTPRIFSKSYVVALALRGNEVEAMRVLVDKKRIKLLEIACRKKYINPRRDRYC